MGMRTSCVAFVLVFASLPLESAVPCKEGGPYLQALCHYRQKAWTEAESEFSAIVEAGLENPETIKALYFRGRTRMKLKRWDEASTDLIRIYTLYPAFFQEWNGDFLLGECREMLGKD